MGAFAGRSWRKKPPAMRRALLRNASSLCTHHLLRPSPIVTNPKIVPAALPFSRSLLSARFCSSSSSSSSNNDSSDLTFAAPKLDIQATEETEKEVDFEVKDVDNEEFRRLLNNYLRESLASEDEGAGGDDVEESDEDEDAEKQLADAVVSRVLSGKYDEDHEHVIDILNAQRVEAELNIKKPKKCDIDSEEEEDEALLFDHGLSEIETDHEIDDLYDVRSNVEGRFTKDFLNVDDKKWDELIKEKTGEGYSETMQELADILEDMQGFDKLLPDEIKEKVKEKLEELETRCERGEFKLEEARELYSKFEEDLINEHIKITEAEGPPLPDKTVVPYKANEPAGEGPILRWQTRVVFSPGDKQWHPKNRKVKLSVTVKELGLTKHQFRRLRSLVGKRYHPGRDELTITSERFELREENRKDCLRTLLALIEEAGKAEKLVQDARASHVKERLKANPAFMERLNAKIMRLQAQSTVPV